MSQPRYNSHGLDRKKGGNGTMATVPTESQEQQALFQWAELRVRIYPELRLLFAIPNGSNKSIATAMRFKREGLKAGVPDIMLPVARGGYHGLFVELKRIRGGRLGEDQGIWRAELLCQSYQSAVCKGWQEAAKQIELYLAG